MDTLFGKVEMVDRSHGIQWVPRVTSVWRHEGGEGTSFSTHPTPVTSGGINVSVWRTLSISSPVVLSPIHGVDLYEGLTRYRHSVLPCVYKSPEGLNQRTRVPVTVSFIRLTQDLTTPTTPTSGDPVTMCSFFALSLLSSLRSVHWRHWVFVRNNERSETRVTSSRQGRFLTLINTSGNIYMI